MQKISIMKKLLFISVVFMAMLASCGGSDKEQKSENTKAVQEETTKPEQESYIKDLTYKGFLNNVWNFEKNTDSFAFEGERPCVIDFYATWCGPCKMIAPIMEKLAKEYDGKVDFYKVDTDAEPKLATILQIRNIPMVMFLKEGSQPAKSVGAKGEEYYRKQINMMLNE